MKVFDFPQYSGDWWQVRQGVPTASAADRILTPTGKPAGQQEGYIAKLIGDLACLSPNAFTERGRMGTPEMEAGRRAEPEARNYYAMIRKMDVRQVGFCLSDCGRVGCSPDGVVGDTGLLELKAPMLKTQAAWLMKGGLPPEYKPQVHFQLLVTDRAFVDFLSYAPGLPPLMVTVEPDDFTKRLRDELEAFWLKYEYAATQLLPREKLLPAMRREKLP